ncbi:MAG: dTMP kinase [Syntrophomonadaceae bacterium]|jgi:dTMP kinase|nr:dTMP kinase [Syntrophomonadaceae bacterium]
MDDKGLFISLEGIDGCGKSSIIAYLNSKLDPDQLVNIREPGGTVLSEIIRDMLLNDECNYNMEVETEALLYAAARSQVVTQVIKPALLQGKMVLADRFIDSTIAYQGYGRGLDIPYLQAMNRFCTGGLKPHLTILLDLEPELSYSSRKSQAPDRIEREGMDFQKRVRWGYLQLAAAEPNRITIINAAQDFDRVSQLVLVRVQQAIDEQKE